MKRTFVFPLLVCLLCGASACSTMTPNQKVEAKNAALGALTLATALASVPLPPSVAGTQTAQEIKYWSDYAKGVSKALGADQQTSPFGSATPSSAGQPSSTQGE